MLVRTDLLELAMLVDFLGEEELHVIDTVLQHVLDLGNEELWVILLKVLQQPRTGE